MLFYICHDDNYTLLRYLYTGNILITLNQIQQFSHKFNLLTSTVGLCKLIITKRVSVNRNGWRNLELNEVYDYTVEAISTTREAGSSLTWLTE